MICCFLKIFTENIILGNKEAYGGAYEQEF